MSEKERKNRQKKSTLEAQILRLIEKSVEATLKKAMKDLFKDWK